MGSPPLSPPLSRTVSDDRVSGAQVEGAKLVPTGKTLKRYLRRKYSLTPEQYRVRWHLPEDYPMVAPGYAQLRSLLARRRPP
jgi:predicted transcriptional regulator